MSIPSNVQSTDTFLTWRNATNSLIDSFSDRSEHTSAPSASDDSANTSGNGVFRTGSVWIDTVAKEIYFCQDATPGAAVWEKNNELTGHLAAPDPHPQYATDTDLSAHVSAPDPHLANELVLGTDNATRIPRDLTANTDFNTIQSSGTYNFNCTSSPNAPFPGEASWCFLEVFRHPNLNTGSEYIVQIYHDMNYFSVPRIASRKCIVGTWRSWEEVAKQSDISAHVSATDPHPQYATDTDLSAHVSATDPHLANELVLGTDNATRIPRSLPDNTDFNTIISSGTYNFDCISSPNRPFTDTYWCFLEVNRHTNLSSGSEYVSQVYYEMNYGSVPRMAIRRNVLGTWSNWAEVSTANNSLGISQTWQNVTSSRALNTVYTNTTGRPIMVYASYGNRDDGTNTRYLLGVLVDGIYVGSSSYNSSDYQTVFVNFIVPSGSTYQIQSWYSAISPTSPYNNWAELR